MIHVHLRVQLTLVGPILTQSTSAGRMGLDAVMARTAVGRPYLPYSQVRGKLRQALEELADRNGRPEQQAIADLVPFWFGPRRVRSDADHERGALNFSDFVHPVPKDDSSTRTRIRIDQDTGAAQEKMMMVLDSPFQVGETASFVGEIRCFCGSIKEAENTVKFVLAGLRWIRQIGAERTIGFGRVQSVEPLDLTITELEAQPKSAQADIQKCFDAACGTTSPPQKVSYHWCSTVTTPAQTTRFLLRLRPKGPFCLGGVRRGDNLFDSEEIIPGGAILGTLATMWRQTSGLSATQHQVEPTVGKWNKLAENFAKLVITHAFPCKRGLNSRPCAIPLSLAAAEPWHDDNPNKLYDVALCSRPRLIPEADTNRPPVFQPDWKTHVVGKTAKTAFGWTDLPSELRVRTAIDAGTLKAADEQLFAYKMVLPDEHEWLAYLDLFNVAASEQHAVLVELKQLLAAGLGPIGKTKMNAEVSIEPVSNVQPKWVSDPAPLPAGGWVVTLQTPSVLCKADDLQDSTGDGLFQGYQSTWNALSGGALRLRHFFARQLLSAPRFAGRLPRNTSGQYYPFVLTDAGSTFVLDATGDKKVAQSMIEEWLERGVPVRQDLLGGSAADADWQRCPYLNRHGYGEISVNPPWLKGQASIDMPIRLKDETP
jgi:RAMP superfamily